MSKQKNQSPTPRLNKQGEMHERWDRLFRFDSPRYIRCYDNGGKSADRYTVVFSQLKQYSDGYGSVHTYISMSHSPFHPHGFGQHGETYGVPCDYPNYGHLGKKITFADLNLDGRWFVLMEYCSYWNLRFEDHPIFKTVEWGAFAPQCIEGVAPWRPVRPPKGQFDSRGDKSYREEVERLNNIESIQIWISLVTEDVDISDTDIMTWDYADRADVRDWAVMAHLRASDNHVKVPEMPSILLKYGRTRIHA
jgi:hypothetical protein